MRTWQGRSMNLKTEHFPILTTPLLRSSKILGRSAVFMVFVWVWRSPVNSATTNSATRVGQLGDNLFRLSVCFVLIEQNKLSKKAVLSQGNHAMLLLSRWRARLAARASTSGFGKPSQGTVPSWLKILVSSSSTISAADLNTADFMFARTCAAS